MKVWTVLCAGLAVLIVASLGNAVTLSRPGVPNVPGRWAGIDSTGGPDRYGYTWRDTIIQGAFIRPDTTTWTRVTGLGDDNFAGPFSIGFEFPYYWYRATTFGVGSNGYINFGEPGLNAANFDTIPDPAHVNDLLAIYESDLDFSGTTNGGRVWFKTNNRDSLIVAYLNVPHWYSNGARGNNNFEIILSKSDSTITFVYDTVTVPTNYDPEIGIENGSGTLGLERRRTLAITPIPNFWVIRFTPPTTTTYEALDTGPVDMMNTGTYGFFRMQAETLTLWSTVKNQGNVPIPAPYDVYFRIEDSIQTVVKETLVTAPPSVPNQVDTLQFGLWVPPSTGNYNFMLRTLLSDSNFFNNSKFAEFWSVDEPPLLRYDLNVGAGYSWSGNYGGFGNKFTPPEYPIKMDTTYLYIYPGTNRFISGIYDATGSGGSPGNLLGKMDTVPTPSSAQWFALDQTTKNIVVTSGAFFVAWFQDVATPPAVGTDTTRPISRNAWEFTGVWAPWRESNRDLMIRVKAHKTVVGVESGEGFVGNAGRVSFAAVRPNPGRSSATLSFSLPKEGRVRLAVYDLRGALVRTLVDEKLPPGEHRASWNGRDDLGRPAASGVYFYRLEALGMSRTQKGLLLR
jgi:hypothetical protein